MKEIKKPTETVSIIGYNEKGNGTFLSNGMPWEISNVVEKDVAEVDINYKNREARLIRIKEKSPYRTKPKCPIFEKCGGCQIQHMIYSHQLEYKKRIVEELFKKTLKKTYTIKPCLGMDNPYYYRNKNQMVFGNDPKLKVISGFYVEGTHKVINFDNCYLQDDVTNKIVATIKDIMVKLRLSAYNEDRKTGLIRHVMVKRSFSLNETMVILVTGTEVFPGRNNFLKMLLARHPEITTVIQNINPKETSAVLGNKEIVLYGKGYITDCLGGYIFKISSQSFYQVNPKQTVVLYLTALKLANLSKTNTLLDAYSGVGTIGIFASSLVDKVISVELEKSAHLDAIENAKMNKIKNVRFFNDDATRFLINMARRKEKVDVVIMDPPRSGSTPQFLQAILMIKPQKVVYISCNPYTLVNDLQTLIKDYEINTIQPVDMFPQTNHVECVVLMSRVKE
ncbi:MAG TPA: 23S rRNA (uracil(1939)-C(5))-methyltransferase RlmD [Acholeplasmataceae bacterium]|nr:23S rRNA (uracil(1939)-C(5))-methyltransferase RlmD [Acholeplasmataceae bacterium]